MEGDPTVFESMFEHRYEAVGIAGVVECVAELADGIVAVLILESGPLLRLCLLDEIDQGADIQPQQGVIIIISLGVSALK